MYLRLITFLKKLLTHTLPCVEPPSAFRLYPGRLLIIQSTEYVSRVHHYTLTKVVNLCLGSQGSKDFPASRCVAFKSSLLLILVLPDSNIKRNHIVLPRCFLYVRLGTVGDLFQGLQKLTVVNPCGNFSDTSSLKLVKLKDR